VDRHAAQVYKPGGFLPGTAAEQAAMLPDLEDDYKAHGTPENGEISRLVLVMGKDGFRVGGSAYVALQYVHISLGEFGFTASGQWFRFLFADLQPKLVTVQGRNLLRVYDYISLRRMPWLRQADDDFQPAEAALRKEPFIRLIGIEDWKRPRAQAAELAQAVEEFEDA
jgi:hypothetical protein